MYVATSTGRAFSAPRARWHSYFAPAAAVPGVGDFDGDGSLDDIATFRRGTNGHVWVAKSTGASFGTVAMWRRYFATGKNIPVPGIMW